MLPPSARVRSAPTQESGYYRPDIDGLRAVAVLAVLGFHGEIGILKGGFVGVDVFFVISGYLISGIIWRGLEAGTFSFSDFYARRINRILPSLLVVLIATAVLGWPILYPGEFSNLGKHLLGGSTFTSNFILWNETGYFDSPSKPLLHLWSLAIEEQFYLLWPVVLVSFGSRRWNVEWLLMFMLAGSFVANILLMQASDGNAAFYSPISRFWEIVAGALLCRFERIDKNGQLSGSASASRQAASVAGILILGIALATTDRNTPWPGWLSLLPVLAATLLIAGGANAWINRRLLSNRMLVEIGLISYPLYLWHLPLLVYARLMYGEQPPKAIRVVLMALSIVLAFATYRYVDKPIRFGANKRKSAKRLVPALGLMALIGLSIYATRVAARLDNAYAKQVEAARKDEAWGGYFINAGKAIVIHEIPGDSTNTLAILGDSHAGQYRPRFIKLAQLHRDTPRVLFLTYGACPPLPRVNHVGISWDGSPFKCQNFYRLAMDRVNSKNVKTVVFAAYWHGYQERGDLFLVDDPNKKPIRNTGAEADRAFNLFEKEVSRLIDAGKEVHIVLSNPTSPAFNPLSILPPRMPGGEWDSSSFLVSRSEVAEKRGSVTERLRQIASRTGARLIDPLDHLCNEMACRTVTANRLPIYSDDHHLRATFVRDHVTFLDHLIGLRPTTRSRSGQTTPSSD